MPDSEAKFLVYHKQKRRYLSVSARANKDEPTKRIGLYDWGYNPVLASRFNTDQAKAWARLFGAPDFVYPIPVGI